jgi:hypothetical protein
MGACEVLLQEPKQHLAKLAGFEAASFGLLFLKRLLDAQIRADDLGAEALGYTGKGLI